MRKPKIMSGNSNNVKVAYTVMGILWNAFTKSMVEKLLFPAKIMGKVNECGEYRSSSVLASRVEDQQLVGGLAIPSFTIVLLVARIPLGLCYGRV